MTLRYCQSHMYHNVMVSLLLSESRLKIALMCRAWPGKLSLQGVLAPASIETELAGDSGLS